MEAGVGLVPPAPKRYNMADRLRRIQELLTPAFKEVYFATLTVGYVDDYFSVFL